MKCNVHDYISTLELRAPLHHIPCPLKQPPQPPANFHTSLRIYQNFQYIIFDCTKQP